MATEWYYTTNRQQMGPVSWEELQQLAERGLLKPQDLVWSEGMAEWVKASRQQGLFPVEAEDAPPPPKPKRPRDDDDGARVRRRRLREEDDEDDDEEEEDELVTRKRRRKRARQQEGMAVGLRIGLAVAGGVFLLGVLICGGIWLVAHSAGDGGPMNYSVNLQPKRASDRQVYLKAGKQVVVTVTSTSVIPNNDVDLHIYHNNNLIAMDESIGPNSRIVFFPPQETTYKFQVRNLGNASARCQVNVQPRQ